MTASRIATARERLAAADASLSRRFGPLRSLDPNRATATPLTAVFDHVAGVASRVAPEVQKAFAQGLADIVEAQAEHFPNTIYWDIDSMASCIANGPASRDAAAMRDLCEEITELQAQYGRNSILAFQYTHDFTYGFDWAKWVRRAPRKRAEFGPFDPHFIAYLRRRGRELVDLIANDDDKYPKLPDGRPRNPFGFRREPDHEARLFADLADRDLLPLRGWETGSTPRCDRPFAELRTERARALGIPTKPVGGT